MGTRLNGFTGFAFNRCFQLLPKWRVIIMSQAVRAWNASRPGVAKRKARQISLCSHILYL